MLNVQSREELYNYFDDYTLQRKSELNQRALKPGSGLLKAYVMETNSVKDISSVFAKFNWKLNTIDDDLYEISGLPEEMDGFIDVFSHRYLTLYTTAKTSISDVTVRSAIRSTSKIDHMWLSSPFLNLIWLDLTDDTKRHAVLRYEIEPHFDSHYFYGDSLKDDDDDELSEDEINEPPQSRLEVKSDVSWLRSHFGRSSDAANLIGNLTRVRVPRYQRGKHEYYHDGKVTNRGNEFKGFAYELRSFVEQVYGKATELIEDVASFYVDSSPVEGGFERTSIKGAPISYIFKEPLSDSVFARFIDQTFNRGAGPFKLWGSPIMLSERKYHIYGLDLHLWQQVYIDMTPERFILVLPEGTCGNTVHRFTANIQRFLSPRVQVYIGSEKYEDLIRRALRSQ